MINLTITIRIPTPSFSKKAWGLIAIGFLLGGIVSFVAYDLTLVNSKIDAAVAALAAPPGGITLSEKRRLIKAFERRIPPKKGLHLVKIAYRSNCSVCAQNAQKISKILNTAPGWQVMSMSSQISSSKQEGRITVRVDDKSTEAKKTAETLMSVLAAAQIPFRQEKAKEGSGDVVLFFGQPGT